MSTPWATFDPRPIQVHKPSGWASSHLPLRDRPGQWSAAGRHSSPLRQERLQPLEPDMNFWSSAVVPARLSSEDFGRGNVGTIDTLRALGRRYIRCLGCYRHRGTSRDAAGLLMGARILSPVPPPASVTPRRHRSPRLRAGRTPPPSPRNPFVQRSRASSLQRRCLRWLRSCVPSLGTQSAESSAAISVGTNPQFNGEERTGSNIVLQAAGPTPTCTANVSLSLSWPYPSDVLRYLA